MKITITIKEKLYKSLKDYCNLNGIDIETFCNDAINKELMEQKYGDIPFGVIGKAEKNELPSIEIEEKEIPIAPIANEIIPADKQPFDAPDGASILISMDEVTSVEKVEKKEENKEKTKNKRRRL